MKKQPSSNPARIPSPADFAVGSPESRAAARWMAGNQCKMHVYMTDAEAKAAADAHSAALVACPFSSDTPFISLEGIPGTDAVAG